MNILLTNDDGVHAPGLQELRRALRRLGDVTVVAPEAQQSAVSSSLTLYVPLFLHSLPGHGIYAVGGTPADAVKIAIREVMKTRPDLVVSGINAGLNTGSNLFYSGTVAGALEGALWGIPSVAVSLQASDRFDFRSAAATTVRVIRKFRADLEPGVVLNVNVPARPAAEIAGVRWTRPEPSPFVDRFTRRKDPRGRVYYWMRGNPDTPQSRRRAADRVWTDDEAIHAGYVSVTPLRRDLTDEGRLRAKAHLAVASLRGSPKSETLKSKRYAPTLGRSDARTS